MKTNKPHWFLLAFCFFFVFGFTTKPEATSMKGVSIEYSYGNSFEFKRAEQYPLQLEVFSTRERFDGFAMQSDVVILTNHVFNFAESKGLPMKECRGKTGLEIYKVEMDFLNDPARFDGWKLIQPNVDRIWGLYLPFGGQINAGTIFLTDQGREINFSTLGHELAHYWYDRLCWNAAWKGNTEDFAEAFEVYLKGVI